MACVALQNALAAIDDHSDVTDEKSALVAAKCRGLMVGYDARWRDEDYKPVSVEDTLLTDLVNPDTGRTSRSFRLGGKLDVVAEHEAQRVLIDHKTTSLEISTPDAPFWSQLVIEGQVSHYFLLLWQHGIKPDRGLWDVMKKPGIAPKKLTKADAKAVTSLREYFDQPVSQASVDAVVENGRETLELYEARLAWDTQQRPDHYFQRRSIPRLDSELFEYAREIWEHSQEILHCRNTKRRARNSGACMLYGSPCKYLGICSGMDTPDSDKWTRKEQVHSELELEGDGRDVITNSRIRCFQTCRRKHYYRYELGIRRMDEEEREALYFGSLWHEAQQAWWESFLQEETKNQ